MIINIEVKNRVATYISSGSDPVCGSNNDTVKFHFDEEWRGVPKKTARFVWGGRYYDQEFEGDSCPVPVFVNLTRVWVGVYAGEPAEQEPAWATTKAEIPYNLSVRCGYELPHPESGKSYTNEAKGYALEAQAAAEIAIAAADRGESVVQEVREELEAVEDQIVQAEGMKEVGRLKLRIYLAEVANEDGAYGYALTFGESMIDPDNGAVLLSCFGENISSPVHHSLATMVMKLMRCPVTRVVMEHSDPNYVLTYPTVFDTRAAGEYWGNTNISFDGSVCRLYDTEWSTAGPRLVVNNNPHAGSPGADPIAVFLQFPKELQYIQNANVLELSNDSSYLSCTIIGYQ